MKSIMLSIKPQYVAKILNGNKTIEVRKKFPADYVGWVYIYCTKGKQELLYSKTLDYYAFEVKHDDMQNALSSYEVNGKVVARFWCDKVDEIRPFFNWGDELEKETCLTKNEVLNYLNKNESIRGRKVLGLVNLIHISKLEIFDKPKDISEFIQTKRKSWEEPNVKRPPQSFMYVEEEE